MCRTKMKSDKKKPARSIYVWERRSKNDIAVLWCGRRGAGLKHPFGLPMRRTGAKSKQHSDPPCVERTGNKIFFGNDDMCEEWRETKSTSSMVMCGRESNKKAQQKLYVRRKGK